MHCLKKWALLLALAMIIAPGAHAEAGAFEAVEGGVYRFSEDDLDESVFEKQEKARPQSQAQTDEGVPIPTATLNPQMAELPWNLVLVNRNNPVPDDWNAELTTLSNGRQVDSRIVPELTKMFEDCIAAGLKPMVKTAYRTYEDQKEMVVIKYRQFRNEGLSKKQSQIEALKLAAYPGYSEHQLGLAVDIDSSNQAVCSNEEVWIWMKYHCQDYGFIWRYPSVKTEITGISNENWHFRYVGVEAATYIMENRLSLEEYLYEAYGIPY